ERWCNAAEFNGNILFSPSDPHSDSYAHTDSNTNSNCYCDGNTHRDHDSDSHTYFDTETFIDAATSANAPATSYSGTAPVAFKFARPVWPPQNRLSNSRNTVSFSSAARTTNRLPSSRCASAI